jgi:hypothetical protein
MSRSFFAPAFSAAGRKSLALFPEPIFLLDQGQLVNTYFLQKELFLALPHRLSFSGAQEGRLYQYSPPLSIPLFKFFSCISKTWVAEALTVYGQCASYNYTLKNDFWRGNICNAWFSGE